MAAAYTPPAASGGRPAVIVWYRVYTAVGLIIYTAIPALAAFMTLAMGERHVATLLPLAVFSLVAFAFMAFYGIATFVPYKPWGWMFGLVAIAFGMASVLIVVAVPLLVFWLKPETKAAFGRL